MIDSGRGHTGSYVETLADLRAGVNFSGTARTVTSAFAVPVTRYPLQCDQLGICSEKITRT
jgi:hypothetical protein